MPKAEWGTKRICPTTGKRFYDLNRTPIVSPYTGEVVDIESVRRKMAASVISRAVPEKDDDVLVEDLEAEDVMLEGAVADDAELELRRSERTRACGDAEDPHSPERRRPGDKLPTREVHF